MAESHASALLWTEEDQSKCIDLLCKARDTGALPALMHRVLGVEPDWDLVTPKSTMGAMSDASKRQREEEPAPSYAGHIAVVPVPMPMVSAVAADVAGPKSPPGVPTLEVWGRTVIPFGKMKDRRTYASLFRSTDKDDVSYVHWLESHYSKGSAQLRDLVEYFMAMKGFKPNAPVGSDVLIPGTNVPRQFVS